MIYFEKKNYDKWLNSARFSYLIIVCFEVKILFVYFFANNFVFSSSEDFRKQS